MGTCRAYIMEFSVVVAVNADFIAVYFSYLRISLFDPGGFAGDVQLSGYQFDCDINVFFYEVLGRCGRS